MRRWKLVQVSSNTNSFGLYGFIWVADDRTVVQAAGNDLKRRELPIGTILTEETEGDAVSFFARQCFEIPRISGQIAAEAIPKIFNDAKSRAMVAS